MPLYWMLVEGADLGNRRRAILIAATCPELDWVAEPRHIDARRLLGVFRAPNLLLARETADIVGLVTDAFARVWPAAVEELEGGRRPRRPPTGVASA